MFNASRSRFQVIIYTDHSVTVSIVKQTKLTTSNTDKFNFRFVRVSIYFFQFELDVKHKPGKLHVIPNALYRLAKNTFPFSTTENVLDVYRGFFIVEDEPLPAYHITLVKMADDFKTRFKQIYQDNKQWKRIFGLVHPRNEKNNPPIPEGLRFQYRDGFIYYTNEHDGRKRLCIPKTLKKKSSSLHMTNKVMEFFTRFMTESCFRYIYGNSAVISNTTSRTALIVN